MVWAVLCVLVFLSIIFFKMSIDHIAVNILGEITAAAALWFMVAYPLSMTKKLDLIIDFVLIGLATIMLVVFLIRYLQGVKTKSLLRYVQENPQSQIATMARALTSSLEVDRMPGEPVNRMTEDRMPGMPYEASSATTEAAAAQNGPDNTSGTRVSSKSRSAVLAGKVPDRNFQSERTVAALKKIIKEFGIGILEKPSKLIGVFGDYEPDLTDEKKVLKQCFEANIAKDLVDCRKKSAEKKADVRQQCVERVVSKTFMDRSTAEQAIGWICESIGW